MERWYLGTEASALGDGSENGPDARFGVGERLVGDDAGESPYLVLRIRRRLGDRRARHG